MWHRLGSRRYKTQCHASELMVKAIGAVNDLEAICIAVQCNLVM